MNFLYKGMELHFYLFIIQKLSEVKFMPAFPDCVSCLFIPSVSPSAATDSHVVRINAQNPLTMLIHKEGHAVLCSDNMLLLAMNYHQVLFYRKP